MSFILGTSIGILSLAGPTWRKQRLPQEKVQAVVLIVLDVSRSMLAMDIQPNRLERAKLKLSDFLDANPRARAGLIAFAGSAHPVLPFTGDYALIKHHAASLFPRIMPVPGTNWNNLLQAADSILRIAKAPATLLLMTDVLDMDDAALLDNFIEGKHFHLEILLFSTPAGAAVPGHPGVFSKQDPFVLQNLSQDSAITITPLTLDRSDVQGIAKRISQKLTFEKTDGKGEKDWEDMGGLWLLPVLLIVLFWFRRGWAIQWCWPVLVLPALMSCGVRSKHPDWWYSRDYQGQMLENAGRYAEAADRYDDDQRKAIAYYKAGNYEAAADLFALDTSAAAEFNRGLALAKLGRYDEAVRQMQDVAKKDPSLGAETSKSIDSAKSVKQKAEKDSLKERKAETEDEQLSSDTRAKKLPTNGNRVTDEVASNIHMGKEAKEPPKDFSAQKPGQSSEMILMRQTNADPSEFLHRRFELQVKRYHMHLQEPLDPW